jgi:hypothetical protein
MLRILVRVNPEFCLLGKTSAHDASVRVRPKHLTLRADFAANCKIWVKATCDMAGILITIGVPLYRWLPESQFKDWEIAIIFTKKMYIW